MSLQLVLPDPTGQDSGPSFEDRLSGYHRISLERPYPLDYVSQSFCSLLGYSPKELQLLYGEDASLMVHEQDRPRFLDTLEALRHQNQGLCLRYRLQKRSGSYVSVCGIFSPSQMEDGRRYALSVVSDASDQPEDLPLGDLVSLVLPYGYLQCTCEKFPKVTYINQALRDYLYIDRNPEPWEQNARENVFFMLPFGEREKFRLQLEQAHQSSGPVRLDHKMIREDGALVHMVGWVSLVPGERGTKEYAIIYRPVEEAAREIEHIRDAAYFPALRRSYNAIFTLDLETSMVECIHGLEESPVGGRSGIRMTLESAMQIFLKSYILSEDRNMMAAYLTQISDPEDDWAGRTVLQAEFRVEVKGESKRFIGVAVRLEKQQVLLCCRDVSNLVDADTQVPAAETLHTIYDWMDFLSTKGEGTIGMLLLNETPAGCSLLYGSAPVLHYLGFDTPEMAQRSEPPTLAECLASAGLTREEFDQMTAGRPLYLWSRSAPDAFQFQLTCKTFIRGVQTLYIIWCNKNDVHPEPQSARRIFARTFGHFDLFLDNTPITFSSAKEKELMALLIDRVGGTLSPGEAISYLWPEESNDERTSARYRKLAMGLKRTLEKYGIADIILNQNGIRSIDTTAISCDYYELLAGNEKYRRAFHNAYMTDYSWSEETLGSLWKDSEEE